MHGGCRDPKALRANGRTILARELCGCFAGRGAWGGRQGGGSDWVACVCTCTLSGCMRRVWSLFIYQLNLQLFCTFRATAALMMSSDSPEQMGKWAWLGTHPCGHFTHADQSCTHSPSRSAAAAHMHACTTAQGPIHLVWYSQYLPLTLVVSNSTCRKRVF